MPSQQELESRGGRKLRRAAEAAPLGIERARQTARRLAEQRLGQRLGGRRDRGGLLQGVDERTRLTAHVLAPLAVGIGDGDEQLAKRGQAVSRLGRKVGAAEERLA